jgi:hypothetical protein
MIDNSDTSPDTIRASYRRKGNPLLSVQATQSLGMNAGTASDVQGANPGASGTVSRPGSAGSLSFGADALLQPGSGPEAGSERYQSKNGDLEELL